MSKNYQLYHSNVTNEKYLHNSISIFLKEIYDLMKECYGPYGSHILIGSDIRPEATKDGKTILSKVKTNSTISSAVHGSIMSVADKQVYEVGDGSTTTILLLCKLYERFREIIDKYNVSPSVFNSILKKCVSTLISDLKESSHPVVDDNGNIDFDLLEAAVHTSVDGDVELSNKIMEMFKELNCVDPLVLIEMSPTEHHSYDLVKGLELDGSIIRPDVFFGGFSRMEYENPKIVVVNGRLDISLENFCDVANYSLRSGTDIIFLATGMNETVLENIVNINNMNPGQFNRIAVFQIRQTAQNDEFLDACAGLGAKPIDSESLKKALNFNVILKQIEQNSGTCSKALLTEFCARFNDPKSDDNAIANRLAIINEKIDDLNKDSSAHNDRIIDLEARKAFLSRHYAKFYVGGYSPQRKAINYELANDGIPQAISCMKHGIVDGCNTVISQIMNDNEEKYTTNTNNDTPVKFEIYKAIVDSYKELYIQLVANKTSDFETAKNIVEGHGYHSINIRENDNIDVINSADTDRAILENATDMAALLATSKGFLSTNTEFDVVNKGLHSTLGEF